MKKLVFEAKVPSVHNMSSRNMALWIATFALLVIGLTGILLLSPILCIILCIAGIVATCLLLFRYCKNDGQKVFAPCNIGLIADKDTVRWMIKKHSSDKYADIAGYDLEKEYIAIGDIYINGNEFSAKMFDGKRMSFVFNKDEDREQVVKMLQQLGWKPLIANDKDEYFNPELPENPAKASRSSKKAEVEVEA